MTRATDPAISQSASSSESTPGHVCPFCGLMREVTENFDPSSPCPRCTLSDTSTTRNATRSRVGPWSVRQVRNPWAPGMRFETLLALVKRGQVTRDSVVRGPTTHQLWRRAADVKGLSREFGVCYSCGGEVDTQATLCTHCNRLQEPPMNPDILVESRESSSQTAAQNSAASSSAPSNASSNGGSPASANGNGNGASQSHSRPAAPTPAAPSKSKSREPIAAPVGEPPHIEITSGPMADPDEMLAATDDTVELARQITSRPPVAAPLVPPMRPPTRPPGRRPRPAAPTPPDDALLTPQELATAFQLNFSPPNDNPPRGSRAKRGLIVLLLVGGGVAALMYFRPDVRVKATAMGEEAVASVKTFIESRTTPSKAPVVPPAGMPNFATAAREESPATKPKHTPIVIAPAPEAPPRPVAVAEAPLPIETPSVAVAVPPPAPAPVAPKSEAQTATQIVKPEPGHVEAPRTEAPQTVAPQTAAPQTAAPQTETPKVEPFKPEAIKPEVVAKLPPPAPPAPAPVADPTPAAPVNSYEEAKRLWGKAIDAEANQDYVEAVSCYEKIKKLPADVQPSGLDVRLAMARKYAK